MKRIQKFPTVCFLSLLIGYGSQLPAQTNLNPGASDSKSNQPPVLNLSDFRPKSQLKVKQTLLKQAKFPVVDVHTHFDVRMQSDPAKIREFVSVMDRQNIAICVSMDGKLGPKLLDHIQLLNQVAEERFVVFAHLDFQGSGESDKPETWRVNQPGFVAETVQQIRESKRLGLAGLKFFKQFGLDYRNSDGSLIKIDDPKFDPIWEVCGELKLPVLMHTSDPDAFFEPIDSTNERWEELARRPEWSFYGEGIPGKDELLAARNRVIKKHPETIFIAAHVANSSEDLARVSEWLDQYPNMYVELASRISELGRQPFTARDFLTKYSDRVMFGTDGPWPEQRLQSYWRFLETHDEYFPYSEKPFPPQGFWNIYGVKLEDEVLRKIYFENACRLIPGVAEKYSK